MQNWFISSLPDLTSFRQKSPYAQQEAFYDASAKRAKKRAGGVDVYKNDPLMAAYARLGYQGRMGFNLRNNCAAWATGNTEGERLNLPGVGLLCPQLGDTLGVPFTPLMGKPATLFSHLARTYRLCVIDGLKPLRVRAKEDLPEQKANERLVAVVLLEDKDGTVDTHCVVRAAGSAYFSHKPGINLPPTLLDDDGELIHDPRKAQFGKRLSGWMFFTLPQEGIRATPTSEVAAQLRAYIQAEDAIQRAAALLPLQERVAERSPRFAKALSVLAHS